jgi:hypothetical protein
MLVSSYRLKLSHGIKIISGCPVAPASGKTNLFKKWWGKKLFLRWGRIH